MKNLLMALVVGMAWCAVADGQGAMHPHDEVNNWGRWGEDDELGAANYIEPEDIVEAAKLIRSGRVFSLAIPIEGTGPRIPIRNPPHHFMTGVSAGAETTDAMGFTDDYIYMPLQGSTQWDALSHGYYGGKFYNGYTLDTVTAAGASKLGMEKLRDRFVGRGVLVDVLRYKGGTLEPGYAITRADIEGALKQQGTEVREGDIVLIRTGEVPRFYGLSAQEQLGWWGRQAGIGKDVVLWIRDARISAMAADNLALEVTPNPKGSNFHLHGNILRDLGVFIGELWWLEELAEDCARDGRYEFFLSAPPLHIPGAVGSPINPMAIK